MASIKVKFRPSTVSGREGTVYFQITHARTVKLLFTRYFIFSEEWNSEKSMVMTMPDGSKRVDSLSAIRQKIRWDIEQLTRIIHQFEHDGLDYTAGDIIDEFKRYQNEGKLSNFMQKLIAEKNCRQQHRTAEIYKASLRRFKAFLFEVGEGNDILLYQITPRLIESYETWLYNRGVSPNTSSFYIRPLRATYNRAVESGYIQDCNPFRHVYKGVDKTEKRAVSVQILRKIKDLELTKEPGLDYARDMFMLSLMMRGMSIVDMAFLRKRDLVDGYIIYRRSKTGQRLVIEWLPEMQAIINKYPENPTQYLLPILTKPNINQLNAYRNQASKINRNLKEIAGRVGLKMNLTLY
ncbi:MAG: site-specific integrase, partial [Muribaculaceae bacterium]|nr:site-specific integrase [Muribaculaceae bacterium]